MTAWMWTDLYWWLAFCSLCCFAFALFIAHDLRKYHGDEDQ